MYEKRRKIELSKLAEHVSGRIEGDPGAIILGVCSLDNPLAGHIAMALDPSKVDWAEMKEKPGALIVSEPADVEGIPQIIHKNPRLALTLALISFHGEETYKPGIDPNSFVSLDAQVHSTACVRQFAVIESGVEICAGSYIGEGCYVGRRTVIGEGTKLYPNVTVLHDVVIGKRCIIHPGVVIGGDGFGFTPSEHGNLKVPQVGRVEIGNDVEIGANSTIDRATLDVTVVGNDVKIDNLVQIAHNVKIGPHTRIAAQAGLSGRVEIGEKVIIGGQAGFQNGIHVGDKSRVGGQAGVTRHVRPGSSISGYPARDHRQALQILAAQGRLPELIDRIEQIEKQLGIKSE